MSEKPIGSSTAVLALTLLMGCMQSTPETNPSVGESGAARLVTSAEDFARLTEGRRFQVTGSPFRGEICRRAGLQHFGYRLGRECRAVTEVPRSHLHGASSTQEYRTYSTGTVVSEHTEGRVESRWLFRNGQYCQTDRVQEHNRIGRIDLPDVCGLVVEEQNELRIFLRVPEHLDGSGPEFIGVSILVSDG